MTMALLGAELLAPFVLEALQTSPTRHLARNHHLAWQRRFRRRINLCRAFHHALVRPSLIDALSLLHSAGPALLALGYVATRDPEPEVHASQPSPC
jgi:hypothetical protein